MPDVVQEEIIGASADDIAATQAQVSIPSGVEQTAPIMTQAELDAKAMAAFGEGMAKAPESKPAEVVPPKEDPVVQQEDVTEKPAPDVPDVEVEAEIIKLGMKKETAERFRKLTSENRAYKDGHAALQAEAERARQWDAAVTNTQATTEQFATTMAYLAAINSGDPAQMRNAFEAAKKEITWLAKQLGEPLDGIVDPMDEYPDLAAEIAEGDLTRERALEIIQTRKREALATARDTHTQSQAQADLAYRQAVEATAEVGKKLRTADPAQFAAKLPYITPIIEQLQATVPPDQLAAAIERAYQRIPTPAAAPAVRRPAPSAVPLRPTGAGRTGVAQVPKNDFEAFGMGVADAKAQGM